MPARLDSGRRSTTTIDCRPSRGSPYAQGQFCRVPLNRALQRP